jgi:hypothetical protein
MVLSWGEANMTDLTHGVLRLALHVSLNLMEKKYGS